MRPFCLALLALPLAAGEPTEITTPSGLKLERLAEGKPGTAPKPGDRVKFHFTLYLAADNKRVESTLDRAMPFTFILGGGMVIEGWDEGIGRMDVGSKWKLFVPAALAYGPLGDARVGVPPNADLLYEIEMVNVMQGKPLPAFRPGDPAKQRTTETGLKWEELEEGSGEVLGGGDVVELRCTAWTTEGRLVLGMGGGRLAGEVGVLRLTPGGEKFLTQALVHMKEGAVHRLEVPPKLCWGEAKIVPRLEPNSTTVWQLEVLRKVRFSPLDPAKTKKTASGLEYEVIEEGTGASPGPTDGVAVYYTGWLEDGTEFDSAHRRSQPATFGLDQVIKGWTEGLQLMREGGIYRFRIPAELAYRDRSPTPKIPPNSTLVFEVELLATPVPTQRRR